MEYPLTITKDQFDRARANLSDSILKHTVDRKTAGLLLSAVDLGGSNPVAELWGRLKHFVPTYGIYFARKDKSEEFVLVGAMRRFVDAWLLLMFDTQNRVIQVVDETVLKEAVRTRVLGFLTEEQRYHFGAKVS